MTIKDAADPAVLNGLGEFGFQKFDCAPGICTAAAYKR
jgi:hypothetical protein